MTRFGPRIEPITSPTPGGCANSYATDAGYYSLYKTNMYKMKSIFVKVVYLKSPKAAHAASG